jgi:hypothetical protein
MFQFPRLSSHNYVFIMGYMVFTPCGFPHSDIPGSKPACGYPRLFAARCVLRRLLAPRHPPYALISLTNFNAWILVWRLALGAWRLVKPKRTNTRLLATLFLPMNYDLRRRLPRSVVALSA